MYILLIVPDSCHFGSFWVIIWKWFVLTGTRLNSDYKLQHSFINWEVKPQPANHLRSSTIWGLGDEISWPQDPQPVPICEWGVPADVGVLERSQRLAGDGDVFEREMAEGYRWGFLGFNTIELDFVYIVYQQKWRFNQQTWLNDVEWGYMMIHDHFWGYISGTIREYHSDMNYQQVGLKMISLNEYKWI